MTREEKLRDQFIKSALSSCKHFNGIQNKVCKAGITYMQNSSEIAMPCIPGLIHDRKTWECDQFAIMTREQAEQEADDDIRAMNRTITARIDAKDHAKKLGYGKGRGGVGSLKCPCCEDGHIQYSVASVNGHMHARCSTGGCVSWME